MSRRQDLYKSKKKRIPMATNVNVIMTPDNIKFMEKWDSQKKEQKRVSVIEEILPFVNQRAFEDFGLEPSAFSKEVCKLLLIAKDCIEKQEK